MFVDRSGVGGLVVPLVLPYADGTLCLGAWADVAGPSGVLQEVNRYGV